MRTELSRSPRRDGPGPPQTLSPECERHSKWVCPYESQFIGRRTDSTVTAVDQVGSASRQSQRKPQGPRLQICTFVNLLFSLYESPKADWSGLHGAVSGKGETLSRYSESVTLGPASTLGQFETRSKKQLPTSTSTNVPSIDKLTSDPTVASPLIDDGRQPRHLIIRWLHVTERPL